MRRRGSGTLTKAELGAERIAAAEAMDPRLVVRLLEPFVQEKRRERLREVIDARLASVGVVFEAPHDPHNGAAVVRSCEAFGVQTLHVVESREPFLAAASVARGAQKWIDLVAHAHPKTAIAAARAEGWELIATHPDGELLPEDLAEVPSLAIVLGNERDGIGPELAAACTRRVRVPMRGFVESLNVSVTAAILLSAATTHRGGDLSEEARLKLYARGLYLSLPNAERLLAASAPTG